MPKKLGVQTKLFSRLNPPQVLALGFLGLIFLGGFILWLPVSTVHHITFLDALFTATSATTVTGLVVVDPGTTFTLFGQIVIMCLIQVGGLGFMSFAILVIMLLGRRIGLRQRLLIQEALNQPSVGGVIRLVKILLVFSVLTELIATFFLSLDWVPRLGLWKGIYFSLFHSVSAFNNAGFSLFPNSLARYAGDPVVNLVITMLIITGGLGFTVISDIWYSKEFRQMSLHSKLTIYGTFFLNVFAILSFFLLEYNNPGTIGKMPFFQKLLSSYFQGITPRTAGFQTVDMMNLHPSTAIIFIMLMFIGAGSGSTGSGIKITTFLVVLLSVIAFIRGQEETVVFNRRIKHATLLRSMAIVIVSMTVLFIAVLLLTFTEPHVEFLRLLFEAVSAFGTVGLSMDLTNHLSTGGRFIIMFMMFFGRLGPLTLAFSLSIPKKSSIRFPQGDVFTG